MTPISREIAANVLHFFRSSEGYSGGSFADALYSLAAKADRHNRAKLAVAFPDEMAAFSLAADRPDGLAILRQIATGSRVAR